MVEFNLSSFLFRNPNNREEEMKSTEYNWCSEIPSTDEYKGL
jgi:hypothetical protein